MLLAGHGYLVGGVFVGQRSSKWNAFCSRGTPVSVSLGRWFFIGLLTPRLAIFCARKEWLVEMEVVLCTCGGGELIARCAAQLYKLLSPVLSIILAVAGTHQNIYPSSKSYPKSHWIFFIFIV